MTYTLTTCHPNKWLLHRTSCVKSKSSAAAGQSFWGVNLVRTQWGGLEILPTSTKVMQCRAVPVGKSEESSGVRAGDGEAERTAVGHAVLNGTSHREGGEGGEPLLVETSGRQTLHWRLGESSDSLRPDVEALSSEEITGSLVDAVKGFFLPRGFPASVTPDYLTYQLWAVPCHVTGWLTHSLATSSLLGALGLGLGPGATVGLSAAIKWITKDGIGAAGRVLVGGRLGTVFDEDPKRWRMVAEVFSTTGLALEIATAVYPASFIALAGAGNLSKAVSRGMKNPCFRVVQTHFAQQRANVGDIAAKEEVWEVCAQLVGLSLSILMLRAIEATGHAESAVGVWLGVQGVHIVLRYNSLACLQFPYLNQKRAAVLVRADVAGAPLPGVAEGNAQEQVLAPPSRVEPRVRFGSSMEEAFGPRLNGPYLQEVMRAYEKEAYVLVWHNGRGHALLKEAASPTDMLRCLWQAAWLDRTCGAGPVLESQVEASLAELRARFPAFLARAQKAGWQTSQVVFQSGPTRIRFDSMSAGPLRP